MAFTKKQKRLRYVIYGTLATLVVGFFVVMFTLQYLEKRNFAKAEASLDSLAQQIQDKVGKADEIKKEKTCSYASRVIGKGPRGCGVRVLLLFKDKDPVISTKVMSEISAGIGTKLYDYLGRNIPLAFEKYDGRGPSQEFSQSSNNSYGAVTCAIRYVHPVVPLYDKAFADVSSENLQIGLSCSGPARAEYFPLAD